MEFFPQAATDPNYYTGTYTHFGAIPPSDILGYSFSFNPELPSPYPDFQGTVRVTSLGGQFDLYSLSAYETIGGESFSSYILAVPEPAFPGLVVVALGGLFFYRERSKRRDLVV